MNKTKLISRLSIALLCLGVSVWAFFTMPVGGVLIFIVFMLAVYFDYVRTGKNKMKGPNSELNVQGLTEKYGEPDNTIVADPTRGNEVEGCILVYREKGFLVINGIEVKKLDITDYVLKNDGPNPYIPAEYQLRIETTLEEYPMLNVYAGNEVSWAEQVMLEFQEEMER